MNLSNELTQKVDAHLDEVRKYLGNLPAGERKEILQSLESHIYDALQNRSDGEPSPALLDAVIAEMDPPDSYGEVSAIPQKKPRRQWLIIILILVLTSLGTTVYLKLKPEKKLPESLTSNPSVTTPIIEGIGWGDYLLGKTRTELIEALGEPQANTPEWMMRWNAHPFVYVALSEAGTCRDVRFNRGFKGKTAAGIEIGSSFEEILAAYGDAETVWARETDPCVIAEWPSKGIHIYTYKGLVSQIIIHQPKPKHTHPFKDDPSVHGQWVSIDFVHSINAFQPGKQPRESDLFLKELTFFSNGATSHTWTWTQGRLIDENSTSRYAIKEIGGEKLLFLQWMSGDVTLRGQSPKYYVLKRANSKKASSPQLKPVAFEQGLNSLENGDTIILDEVLSTSTNFAIGDIVTAKGRYTLASQLNASLLLTVTATRGSGRSNVTKEQQTKMTLGSSEFELTYTIPFHGYSHLSFRDEITGQSLGGLHFGTKQQVEEIEDLKAKGSQRKPEKQVSKTGADVLNRLQKDRVEARANMLLADARQNEWTRVKEQPLISQAKFSSDPLLAVLAEDVLTSKSELQEAKEKGNDLKVNSAQASLEKSERKLQAALDAIKKKTQAEYVVAKAKCEALDQEIQRLVTGLAFDVAEVFEIQKAKARDRMREDREIYSQAERIEIETLYQVANKKWRSEEGKESLKELISKYSSANRTGCALLYLGQMSTGDEQVDYLQRVINGFSDCFYGDGVQVGAYARFVLFHRYKKDGENEKAEKLADEIKTLYPDSINHRKKSLVALLKHDEVVEALNQKAEQQAGTALKQKNTTSEEGATKPNRIERRKKKTAPAKHPSEPEFNLQEAIDNASPGDTIMIPPGTYTQPIVVRKKITLDGKDAVFKVEANEPAIQIETPGPVVLKNLEIQYRTKTKPQKREFPHAVYTSGGDLLIEDCVFKETGRQGASPCAVLATEQSTLQIKNSRFYGFNFTIQFWNGSEGSVEDCLIMNPGHCGITIGRYSVVNLKRNIVTGSRYHGIRCTGGEIIADSNLIAANKNRGFYLGAKSVRGTLSNNLIIDNATGINVYARSDLKIANNIILRSSYAGLDLIDTATLNIEDNVIADNQRGLIGFSGEESREPSISLKGKNLIHGNTVESENIELPSRTRRTTPLFSDPEAGQFAITTSEAKGMGLSNPAEMQTLWNKWQASLTRPF